jgi:hypothetical protein
MIVDVLMYPDINMTDNKHSENEEYLSVFKWSA